MNYQSSKSTIFWVGLPLILVMTIIYIVSLDQHVDSLLVKVTTTLPNKGEDEQINTNHDNSNEDEDKQRRKIYLDKFPVEYTNSKNTDGQSFKDLQGRLELGLGLDDIPVPRNLNILFSGDSVTRYQYLDLAYFLAYGKWVNRNDKPDMIYSGGHGSWTSFYNYTNTMLQPYEECDCFRGKDFSREIIPVENRFFLDKERNNSIAYLQKFGDWPQKFSWDVKDVHNKHGPLITDASQLELKSADKWVKMIKEFVCMLEPKPSVFIFNAGLHSTHDLVDVQLQDDIIHELNECNIKSLFKTTTRRKGQTTRELMEYELQLCNKTDHHMDAAWTGLVPVEYYKDSAHFKAPIYSYLNLQLLSTLALDDEIKV